MVWWNTPFGLNYATGGTATGTDPLAGGGQVGQGGARELQAEHASPDAEHPLRGDGPGRGEGREEGWQPGPPLGPLPSRRGPPQHTRDVQVTLFSFVFFLAF